MNRDEKIKLLKDISKGDTSALISLNKSIGVVFIDMIENIPYWIDLDVYFSRCYISGESGFSNIKIQEIINDDSVKKYTTNELKQIHKKRFVFAMPPEMFYNNSESEKMDFYNRYLK